MWFGDVRAVVPTSPWSHHRAAVRHSTRPGTSNRSSRRPQSRKAAGRGAARGRQAAAGTFGSVGAPSTCRPRPIDNDMPAANRQITPMLHQASV